MVPLREPDAKVIAHGGSTSYSPEVLHFSGDRRVAILQSCSVVLETFEYHLLAATEVGTISQVVQILVNQYLRHPINKRL